MAVISSDACVISQLRVAGSYATTIAPRVGIKTVAVS